MAKPTQSESTSKAISLSPIYTRAQSLSRVWLFATPCTVARQASLSMYFPRQEYWNFLLQWIFPTQGSNPCFLHLPHWQADSLPLSTWEAQVTLDYWNFCHNWEYGLQSLFLLPWGKTKTKKWIFLKVKHILVVKMSFLLQNTHNKVC